MAVGLCYRCEHRAKFLENKTHPRYECGCIERAVYSCYMYEPCCPIILKKLQGDRRPVSSGWMISARMQAVDIAEAKLKIISKTKKKKAPQYILYWDAK